MKKTATTLSPIEPARSMKEAAYQRIKAAILANQLKAGEQLKEERLSAELGVSSTPIREALSRLEQEQFVRSIPRRGKFVTEITREDIQDIWGLRSVLEGWAAELATPSIPANSLEELGALFQAAEDEIEQGSYETYKRSDNHLHRLVVEHAGNRWLLKVFNELTDQKRRIRSFSVRTPGSHVRQSCQEHRAVWEALKAREPQKARELMERHVRDSGERIIGLLP